MWDFGHKATGFLARFRTRLHNRFMTRGTHAALCERFLQAVESGDSDRLLDMFTEKAVVTDWGKHFVGPDAIREWNDAEFLGDDVVLDVRQVVNSESRVTLRATVTGKTFNGPSTLVLIPADAHKLQALQISA